MAASSVAARDRASPDRDAVLDESLASAGEVLQDGDEKAPASEEGDGEVVVSNGPHYLEGPRFWLVTVSYGPPLVVEDGVLRMSQGWAFWSLWSTSKYQ